MLIVHTHSELPEAGGAPDWVHLLPTGQFRGVDGRGPYSVQNPEAIVAAAAKRGKLVLDENHTTDHALKNGGPAPAVGWITELQSRQDGIWGHVEWTNSGRKLMGDKAYRGISPAIAVDPKSLAINEIVRASLTNAPNLNTHHLHSQEAPMNLAALREALGLPADADEAAILAAAKAARTTVQTHSQQISRIATAAGAAADATADVIVTALQQRTGSNDQVVQLQSQVTELQTKLARGAAEAAINAALAAGKAIPPAKREEWITRFVKDPEFTQGIINDMPSLHSGGIKVEHMGGRSGEAGQADMDATAAANLGLTKEQVEAGRAKKGGA
ncbi:phage protease [Acidisoma sp. 7E03]